MYNGGVELIIGGSVSIYIVDKTVELGNIDRVVLNGREHDNIHILNIDRYKYVWSLKSNKNSGIKDPAYPANLVTILRDYHMKGKPSNVLLVMDTSDKDNDKLLFDLLSNTRGYIFNDKTNTDHMDLLMNTLYYNDIGYYCAFGIKDNALIAL